MWYSQELNKQFFTHSEIRAAFPQVSFPDILTDEIIAELGVIELADSAPESVAAAKDAHNANIRQQIFALEANQGRALREVALGGNAARLQAIDDQIAALRSQLQ